MLSMLLLVLVISSSRGFVPDVAGASMVCFFVAPLGVPLGSSRSAFSINAIETTPLDTAAVLDVPASTIPEAGGLQLAALAVTFLSILPTPGMLGIGKDVSITDNDATKARKSREAKTRAGQNPKMSMLLDDSRSTPHGVSRRMLGAVFLSLLPDVVRAADTSSMSSVASSSRELTPKELGALRIAELRKVVRLPGSGKSGAPTSCERCFTRSCVTRECATR